MDDRLLRLFELLSGDADVAVAAVRMRAAQVLDECREDIDDVEEEEEEKEEEKGREEGGVEEKKSEATQLAGEYRARRRALLSEIA